jgi:hypothetical protein
MRPRSKQAGVNESSRCGGIFNRRIYSYLPCPAIEFDGKAHEKNNEVFIRMQKALLGK